MQDHFLLNKKPILQYSKQNNSMNKRKGSFNRSQTNKYEQTSQQIDLILSKAKTFSPVKEYGKIHLKKHRKNQSKSHAESNGYKLMPRLVETLSMAQKVPKTPIYVEFGKENDSDYLYQSKNKLQERIQMLVAERKKILSTIDGTQMNTDRTTIDLPVINSCQSVESDIDKQVNFLYPESSGTQQGNTDEEYDELFNIQQEETPLDMIHFMEKFEGMKVEIIPDKDIPVDPGNSALGILIRYLSMHRDALIRIFTDCYFVKDIFRLKIFSKGRTKVIQFNQQFPDKTIYTRAILQKEIVYLYPLLIEKALAKICGGYSGIQQMNIVQMFRIFVAVPAKIIPSSHPQLKDRLNNPNNIAFVSDNSDTYQQLANANQSTVDIISEEMSRTVDYQYLRFLYSEIFYFNDQGKYYQDSLKVKHNPNHFSVLSFKIIEEGQYTFRIHHESEAVAILVKCKSQSILKGYRNNQAEEIEFETCLQKGQYEIIILTEQGRANVQIIGESPTKLSLKHKIEYRIYCSQLVRTYLNSKMLDLSKYKKPTLIRVELFIGLFAQIIVNPKPQPLQIQLSYKQKILCDVNYKKKIIKTTIPSSSTQIIAVRKLCPVDIVPQLDRISLRI